MIAWGRWLAMGVWAVGAFSAPAFADTDDCQKQVVRNLLRYKRTFLRAHQKCLDSENVGRITGTFPVCPDLRAQERIQTTRDRVVAMLATRCTGADIAALGFPGDCNYESIATGAEGACAALGGVTNGTELANCLICWKTAELAQYVGTLYASHAEEICGSALDDTSSTCSDFPCSQPRPNQRNLGDGGEGDCQKVIGRGGMMYLIRREQALEKCALKDSDTGSGFTGRTRADCLADLKVQQALDRAETLKRTTIERMCGNNRAPIANPPFCCVTGTGGGPPTCTPAGTRTECTDDPPAGLGGSVQEGKICDVDSHCSNPPGNQQAITWWENCPEPNTCATATPLASRDDLIDCVDATADQIVDELLCLQFRGNGGADWPCPPESTSTTTTTTTSTTTSLTLP